MRLLSLPRLLGGSRRRQSSHRHRHPTVEGTKGAPDDVPPVAHPPVAYEGKALEEKEASDAGGTEEPTARVTPSKPPPRSSSDGATAAISVSTTACSSSFSSSSSSSQRADAPSHTPGASGDGDVPPSPALSRIPSSRSGGGWSSTAPPPPPPPWDGASSHWGDDSDFGRNNEDMNDAIETIETESAKAGSVVTTVRRRVSKISSRSRSCGSIGGGGGFATLRELGITTVVAPPAETVVPASELTTARRDGRGGGPDVDFDAVLPRGEFGCGNDDGCNNDDAKDDEIGDNEVSSLGSLRPTTVDEDEDENAEGGIGGVIDDLWTLSTRDHLSCEWDDGSSPLYQPLVAPSPVGVVFEFDPGVETPSVCRARREATRMASRRGNGGGGEMSGQRREQQQRERGRGRERERGTQPGRWTIGKATTLDDDDDDKDQRRRADCGDEDAADAERRWRRKLGRERWQGRNRLREADDDNAGNDVIVADGNGGGGAEEENHRVNSRVGVGGEGGDVRVEGRKILHPSPSVGFCRPASDLLEALMDTICADMPTVAPGSAGATASDRCE